MAIQFIDAKKVEDMQAYVEDTIKYQRACAELWKYWVRPVLAKHDGKKMTKRITTDFEKSLKVNSDKFHGYLDTNYGMYHFKVMGKVLGVDFRNKYSFSVYLGCHSQGGVLDLKWVEEHNVFYVKNAARFTDKPLDPQKEAFAALARVRHKIKDDRAAWDVLANVVADYLAQGKRETGMWLQVDTDGHTWHYRIRRRNGKGTMSSKLYFNRSACVWMAKRTAKALGIRYKEVSRGRV